MRFIALLIGTVLIYAVAIGICYLIWGNKGPKLYPVSSHNTEALDIIRENKISYYVENCYAVFGIDIFRSDGVITYNKNGSLYKLDNEFIEKYGITDDFSFWNKYGIVLMYFVFWIAILVWCWLQKKGVDIDIE